MGVLIDDYANPWFVDLLRGLDLVLRPEGFRISVVDSVTSAEDPVDALLSMRADGIVVARDLPPGLRAGVGAHFVVAGTRSDVPPGIDAVGGDDERGARLATEHLLGLGHRCVGHLSVGGGAGGTRRRSFLRVVADAGMRGVATDYTGPATEHAGFDAALRLLVDHPDMTAIFAANDVMAIGALGAARELGLDVPRRLSIVGYDNTALAQTRLINLTTIDDDNFGVGRESARLLLARMAGKQPGDAVRTLAPSLIMRGTTGTNM